MDKWTYRKAMPFLCILTAILIGTLSFTSKMGQWAFFIWVCLIYLCIGGYYAMFPAYTSLSFGNLYMVGNYGWVFTNQFISSFVSAFFVNAFITKLGNLGVTLVLAAMIVVAACLSGFGKKWDYHVGRRQLHPTTIQAVLPNTFVLPPTLVEAEKAEASKTEETAVSVKPAASEVAAPAAPATPEVPSEPAAPSSEASAAPAEVSVTIPADAGKQ